MDYDNIKFDELLKAYFIATNCQNLGLWNLRSAILNPENYPFLTENLDKDLD